KKQSLTWVLALALCTGTLSFDTVKAKSLNLDQDKNITELLKQLENRFDVRFNYESGLKNLKIKNNFDIKNLRKGDIESFVKEVTLNQIAIEKVGNNAYVIQKPTAASVNQASTLVNTISNTVQQT